MANQRFLVIGSNSFSGASLVAALLAENAEVMGISRSAEPDDALLPYKWAPHERFRFHQLDLNRDLERIEAVIHDFRPEYVVNFAAQGMVAQSWKCPEQWFQTNTVAMVRLHDGLRKCRFLKKFVQASTPEVYGSTGGWVREDAPLNPSTPYAVSKAACDMTLLAFHRAYGYPVAMTRAANVCGPGQALYRIIPKTIFCILSGRKLRLEGGGRSVRSFIHIQDVVRATIQIARQGRPGEVYHLATERSQTIRALVEEICRQMGASLDDCVEPAEARLGQDAAYLLDCTKARDELGWSPQRTTEEAIGETIGWMRKHWDRLRQLPAEYVHKE